jgi:hypothetical protein
LRRRWWLLLLSAGCVVVIVGTYSRGDWIAATVALAITLLVLIPSHLRRPAALTFAAALVAAVALLPLAISNNTLQYYILHSSVENHDDAHTSDADHALSLRNGLSALAAQPLGHGLGSAGPATFHAGSTNIIENYFLQVGYETGVLGVILFGGIIIALLIALATLSPTYPLATATAAALIGVSLVGLVLPSWADSTTALTVFTAAGALAGLRDKRRV